MNYSRDERAIIWLDSFAELTREQKLRIIKAAKTPAAAVERFSDIADSLAREIDPQILAEMKSSLLSGGVERAADELGEKGIVPLTCMTDGFPENLLQIPDPPLMLYLKGNVGLLGSLKFTIVGSRRTLPAILSRAEEFARVLTENGVTVVTGIAEGIESSVITGALPSGRIISILPGGFGHVYPDFHKPLVDKIAQSGLVISEHNPDVATKPYNFPERNRLLAAISKGVLVCSAGKRSGTSYTADFANSYGRDVFAFPYTLGVPSGEGCNAMIKEYAMLCDSPDDIFTALGVVPGKKENAAKLSPPEERVFACVKEGEIHIDLLLQKTGMSIREIQPVLAMLEIKKYIVKNPGNTYSAIK